MGPSRVVVASGMESRCPSLRSIELRSEEVEGTSYSWRLSSSAQDTREAVGLSGSSSTSTGSAGVIMGDDVPLTEPLTL